MSDFNTFTGKTVDDAIGEACRFFAVERDKLEVEIVSGGSTGIFGLVGKKKAQIKARRRIDPALAALLEQDAKAGREAAATPRPEAPRPARQEAARPESAPQTQDATVAPAAVDASQEAAPAEANRQDSARQVDNRRERGNGQRPEGRREGGRSRNGARPQERREPQAASGDQPEARDGEAQARQPRRERGERRPRQSAPRQGSPRDEAALDAMDDDAPEIHDDTPASPELLALTGEVMKKLLTPILEQEPAMRIEGSAGRVSVSVLDEEHSGLLIGREGQTLAALQYLANRIVARAWTSPVRVQINTGEYREKQDDNLRRMALYLADKARNLGRSQSTKPLSSYHRRVIHLALQSDETIQTRSKGEGPMKRVIIVPRKPKPPSESEAAQ
ncbi:hypothetical protein NNJEOMEG_00261 [Fundidesulfovibrio magnetotacticus]|uniref:RNA-binding protein KhpB n=1 Tax=Fundidesulfovibrio magnetotacticus TaxID=2730080 RepID=A0A6V8LRM2_9BACT|nr:protein jag [Fundidesulfovibrio magnetotacticus]GFK92436.1 hypothetical protein NNJEOMEG_00261 [Fundidesulfovibrio magnetotacticus]